MHVFLSLQYADPDKMAQLDVLYLSPRAKGDYSPSTYISS